MQALKHRFLKIPGRFAVAFFLLLLLQDLFRQPFHLIPSPIRPFSGTEPGAVDFWITRHLTWHDSQRYNISARRLVFRENGDGFGDRVKALIAVYGYAVLTKRLLVIQWHSPYPLATMISNRSQERFIFSEDIDSIGLPARHGRNYKFRYFEDMPESLIHTLASDVHTVTLKIGPPTQTPDMLRQALAGGRFSHESIPRYTPDIWRLATRQILERSEGIEEEAKKIRRRFAICGHEAQCSGNQTRYIGVHARLGHGVGEGRWRFNRFRGRHRDVSTCLARAVQNDVATHRTSVFVATDTPAFRDVFVEVMKTAMPRTRVVYLNNEPVHFNKIKREETFRGQFVEMAILGDATRIIALRSGYSRSAFWMGQAKHYTQLEAEKCIEGIPVAMNLHDGFLDLERR